MKQTKISLLVTSLLAAAGLMVSGQALAATDTGELTVTASIAASCTIGDATLDFGPYSGAEDDGDTTVSVTCTTSTPYKIYSSTALVDRIMVKGAGGAGKKLTYKLFTDSGRTTQLGVDANGGTIDGEGTGVAQNVAIYGRVDASQTGEAGSYSQTANLTISY